MLIENNTKYVDFADYEEYLSESEKERITEAAAVAYLGVGGYYNLTLSALIRLCANDINALNDLPIEVGTVFCVYFFRGLSKFINDYITTLSKLTIKPTAKEQTASNAGVRLTFGETVLIFAREYFGLRSFAEAEKVTLDEYLIAKRDSYNKMRFEREMARLAAIRTK